ncbi:MAG: cysteine desulfurase, cysteine desulfurase [Candidatus Saccharibacteria bacterium]|nr:cysteine desulfurase, cysteine desulfurase [Candidatus Saccharibacteria bacterium]
MAPGNIYLDHAAATPLDERVLEAMQPYFSELFFNPSSPYQPAVAVRRDYEDAKDRLAHCIGAKGDELVMTAGATESINLAFSGVSGHVVTSNIEHDAVLKAAACHDHTLVKSDERGRINAADVQKALRPDTQLVSIQLANNELGTIQPIRDIAAMIREERTRRLERQDATPLYLHTDASQGVGYLDVNVARLGVDMVTINSGKLYGPKQVGLLWTARSVKLIPQIVGGGQERGLRSGTENVAGTIGFARATELVTATQKSESQRTASLRDKAEKELTSAFPSAMVSGHRKHRLPNFLHISFPSIDAERLVFALETNGVLVATGSACAANKGTRSHILAAIGLPPDVADGSLRLSFGHLSTDENTTQAVKHIIDAVRTEQERQK